MKHLAAILAALLTLSACNEQPAGEPVTRADLGEPDPLPYAEEVAEATTEETEEQAAAVESACNAVTFEGITLTHCVADPAKHRIRTALGSDGGSPYRSLTAFARSIDHSTVAFAVNGGMYGDDGEPVGYYVESGERLKELNRNDGPGNFHMKPNGVFYGTGGSWRIRTSDSFYSNVRDRPRFGTQSGPMLVIGGELHPDIQDNGPSRAIRNGVGVDAQGKAHFVRSEAPLSFGQLARFYRDELEVPNALFLDGNVSALWDPANDRLDTRSGIGPLIVVTKR
ncbi:MAG: phosphodiester glycosidase family protein [Pseudomonadota bacterium]